GGQLLKHAAELGHFTGVKYVASAQIVSTSKRLLNHNPIVAEGNAIGQYNSDLPVWGAGRCGNVSVWERRGIKATERDGPLKEIVEGGDRRGVRPAEILRRPQTF